MSDKYVGEELPVDQWETVRDFGAWQQAGRILPDPAHAMIVTVKEQATGQTVAGWSAMDMVLLEGLYLDPAHRTPAVGRLLIKTMIDRLRTRKIAAVATLIMDQDLAVQACRLGFTPLPGQFHLLSFSD